MVAFWYSFLFFKKSCFSNPLVGFQFRELKQEPFFSSYISNFDNVFTLFTNDTVALYNFASEVSVKTHEQIKLYNVKVKISMSVPDMFGTISLILGQIGNEITVK